MTIERPNFDTASDEEMKRYLRDCWQWTDEKGIEDAERELEKRGHADYVKYRRNQALGPYG